MYYGFGLIASRPATGPCTYRLRIHFADLSVDKSARACLPLGRRGKPRRPGRRARITERRRCPPPPRPPRSCAPADEPARGNASQEQVRDEVRRRRTVQPEPVLYQPPGHLTRAETLPES